MAEQVENAFAAMLVNYDWRHPDLKDYVAQRKAEQASRTDEPGVKLLVLANTQSLCIIYATGYRRKRVIRRAPKQGHADVRGVSSHS